MSRQFVQRLDKVLSKVKKDKRLLLDVEIPGGAVQRMTAEEYTKQPEPLDFAIAEYDGSTACACDAGMVRHYLIMAQTRGQRMPRVEGGKGAIVDSISLAWALFDGVPGEAEYAARVAMLER